MINIYNKDCLEAMKLMQDNQFDLAIVDPPYGIDYSGEDGLISKGKIKRKNGTYATIKRKKHTKKEWDKETPKDEYFIELMRVSKEQIIWGGNYFDLPPTRGIICWDKKQMLETFSRWEYAWSSFNKVAKMFCFDNRGFLSGEENIHPTQKPVKLYEWLLMNYAKEGDKILDTHLGSGSIALACHNLGYDLEGYELDKEYYDNATKRIKQHQAQTTLF
eukprot:GHVU01081232.1.p1 GENE.GHVU01081232.1~~GHVU01081232.1.p1  ORF type:complete len:218 (+),score=24.36 GHVU01081232.1:1051-1704(+)